MPGLRSRGRSQPGIAFASRGVNAPAIASGDQSLVSPHASDRGEPSAEPGSRILGTNPTAYVRTLGKRLGPNYGVSINQTGGGGAIAIAGTLTLLLSIAAGLGVLNTVVLHTRERVHDLGVFKAVGMTPRQTVALVLCSVAGTGLIAGVLALPAGVTVHQNVIDAILGAAGLEVPASLQNVYGAGELSALAIAGLLIALAGALLPAAWAAQSRTATALRAE